MLFLEKMRLIQHFTKPFNYVYLIYVDVSLHVLKVQKFIKFKDH